ncbi:winged helix-turn-helix transcriptional regulator [Streptomyces griseoflavus]|uniref:winged helix-turn-helix transcriptional regulator n=1 Tax=Streptomyces griseoflavus TaxID=35619 RepID=UPI0033BFB793
MLFVLGGLNVWGSRTAGNYLAVSTGLCFSACAAVSLVGDNLFLRGHRADRVVLAHVARHPGATTRQVAQTLGVSERRVTANLDRLTGDGPLMVAPRQRSRSLALTCRLRGRADTGPVMWRAT